MGIVLRSWLRWLDWKLLGRRTFLTEYFDLTEGGRVRCMDGGNIRAKGWPWAERVAAARGVDVVGILVGEVRWKP